MNKEGIKKEKFFDKNFQFNKLATEEKILNFFRNRYNAPFLFGLFKKNHILKVLPYENIDQTLQDTDTLFVGKILSLMNIGVYIILPRHGTQQYKDHQNRVVVVE